MTSRKYLFIPTVSLVLMTLSCKQFNHGVTSIEGQFTGSPHKTLILFELFADSARSIDSVITDDSGKFNIKFKPGEAGFYMVRLDSRNFITLVTDKGESIKLDGKSENLAEEYSVSGSPGSSLYQEYLMFTHRNQEQVDSLSNVFMKSQSQSNFKEIKKQIDSSYYIIFENQQNQVRNFLQTNSNNLVSLLVLNRKFGPNTVVSPGTDLPLFNKIDSLLSEKYAGNRRVAEFHSAMNDFRTRIEKSTRLHTTLQPGTSEPDLRLPDASGNTIRLRSLSGKPHIIYFWASWNAPSRKMNIELVPVYNEFHPRGFEIYAVALDPQKDSWISSYRLDKATWINVNDFKSLESPAAKQCGIESIPTAILIGADGIVKARNIQPEELKGWLMTHYR